MFFLSNNQTKFFARPGKDAKAVIPKGYVGSNLTLFASTSPFFPSVAKSF